MNQKVLIFIVAYNAKDHIRSVFDRLPKEVFNNSEFHILVIDDCSRDETAKTASAHVSNYKYENVTVLRNPINQGYGGNQKLGYRYAVENGYGLAILLHGDGQYAPELVLEFVKRWKEEKADVILGSRMIDKSQARAGGMPLYKWVGNQILTFMQNHLVASDLSEFHTGYRAYSTAFLKRVPFELNTNDFHFDTEILLQAFAAQAKLSEFPIPTRYGDEVCHVNGMKYAKDVMKACFFYRCQKIGFFCSMQYRGLLGHGQQGSVYETAGLFLEKPSKIFVLGKKPQALVDELKKQGHEVTTEESPEKLPSDLSSYHYVLVIGMLELMDNSERFLIEARYRLNSNHKTRFLFSTKNVAFFGLRALLGLGLFNYGERGILTVNTKRLFTLSSFRRMLKETGYVPGRVKGLGLPFQLLFGGSLGKFLSRVSDWFAKEWPSMFAYQFLIEADPKPHAFMLLSSAERFYDKEKTAPPHHKEAPPI